MRKFEHIVRGKPIECDPDTIPELALAGYEVRGGKVVGLPRLYLDAADRFQIADLIQELAELAYPDEDADETYEFAYEVASRFVHPMLLGHNQVLNDTLKHRFSPEQIEFLKQQGVDPELIDQLPRAED